MTLDVLKPLALSLSAVRQWLRVPSMLGICWHYRRRLVCVRVWSAAEGAAGWQHDAAAMSCCVLTIVNERLELLEGCL